ncbi:MAG: DUF4469 domain-containing protein [Marinilabiliaceae bacterium]|nr:DUF4469 domain-containing protein [Marinilabiliaceae bacterium]
MSLNYALLENLLTPAPNDYMAQVQNVKSHDIDSVVARMLERGSTITKTDILAVLEMFFDEVTKITREGETVNLPIFNTRLSVSGVFSGATDSYDASRHAVKVNVNAAKLLTEALRQVKTQKVATKEVQPMVLEVKDSISQSVNDTLTSGGVVEITGSMLKIEGEAPQTGIYFVDEDNTAHAVTTIVDNKPGRLIAIVPTLDSGTYHLQIKTQYNGGGGLKEPRTGTFNKSLTVI